MVRVDIDRVLWLNEQCQEINSLQFEDIVWVKDGVEIEIDRTCFHNWMYLGLSNMTFILSGAYKKPQYLLHFSEYVYRECGQTDCKIA